MFICALCISVSAKDLMYPVSEIQPALLENAHTVIRHFKQEFEIKSEKSAVLSVTDVRTILNKNGEQNGIFNGSYDPMNKISNLKGKMYNEQGKQIKSFGGDDILDYSAISGYSLYEDNRVKFIDPKNQTYPYTVAYSYEIDLKHTLFLPSWSHDDENTSYENSSFIVKVPKSYSFRFKEYNLQSAVTKTNTPEQDIYTWTLRNLVAQKAEPLTSSSSHNYPTVLLASNKFQFGDTKGSSETWNDLGIWITGLNDKKDILPDETKAKMKEITALCKNDFEKVKTIYEYMQKKTRYVSVQVGIGGWQPFDAATVDKTSYGDCKALSNYTKALLSSVGIKSYYTLVRAGSTSRSILTDFPSSQFNHAIVCVPLENDTLWLECTSQRMPCGYNGDFTDDRDVLIIDAEKSKLVHTRIYPASENCITRSSIVNFSDAESAVANYAAKYSGLCYDDLLPIFYADDADQKKRITQSIDIPSFSLTKFSLTENRSKTPSMEEHLNLSITNYIRKIGDVALLPLNFMNKFHSIPRKVRNRKSEMSIRRSYLENDTVSYQLPPNYIVTELPSKVEIQGKFGTYAANTSQKGNNITYIRHFELKKGTFPAEEYAAFRDFLEAVSTADEAVASLKKM
jgi:hypothetical protein